MLRRRQLRPSDSGVGANSSFSKSARCAAPRAASRYALPPVSAKPKPSIGWKVWLSSTSIVGRESCGVDLENANGCRGCSSDVASRVIQPSIIPQSLASASFSVLLGRIPADVFFWSGR